MSQANFYILDSNSDDEMLLFCCRLAKKILGQNYRILIHSEHASQQEKLDKLLWEFQPDSYLPHAAIDTDVFRNNKDIPIGLSSGGAINTGFEVLVNLSPQPPPGFEGFDRFIQVIDQIPERLAPGRALFAKLKKQAFEVNHIMVKSKKA